MSEFVHTQPTSASGAVIERPTGDLAELWQRWARGVERDAQAKRASDKKKRQEQAAQ